MIREGAILSSLGLLLGVAAWQRWDAWALLLVWTSVAFVLVGVAYFFNARTVFGKRANGSLAAGRVLLMLPFLAYTWLVWHLVRLLSSERVSDAMPNGLRLARRPLASELPGDVDLVVDLTAEFYGVSGPFRYVSLPVLDGGVPEMGELLRVVRELPDSGTVLVHCAQGHGRTGLFAACFLVGRKGLTSGEAIDAILAIRPRARMNRRQCAYLEEFERASRADTKQRL